MLTTDDDNNNTSKGNIKFAALACILAFGLLASGLIGSQMLNLAVAQISSNGGQEQENGTNTGNLISAPSYYHNAGTPSIVSTSGTATTKVRPDKFSVTVGVETNSTTAEEAASKNADLLAKVIAAFKDLGIAEKQISTSNYNVYPVYSAKEPANVCRMMEGYQIPPECYVDQEVTSYRASNSVTITLDANGGVDAGKVIDTAIKAGANNVNGVYFFLSNERQEEIRDSLIGEAIANARHRAAVAAKAVGMSVSGVQSINLNDVYFPVFSRGVGGVAESLMATPTLPGEQEVSTTVNIVFFMSGSEGSAQEEDNNKTAGDNAVATARQFILAKLPSLGIKIDDELDLHTDMLVHVSENEFHLDFSVLDVSGQSHDGHIEVVNDKITVATLDGESIL